MDPMQMWLDKLTIIHLGCIVEYGADGRLKFTDVLKENEKIWSSESDFAEERNQKDFTSNIPSVNNANTEDKLQSRFDSRLQILDDLVSKMEAPTSRDLHTNEMRLQVDSAIIGPSKNMIRHGMPLSPIPEEIPGYPERAAKKEQDNLMRLPSLKRQAVMPRDEVKSKQKISRENRCWPLLNEKRIPWRGVKIQWSILNLPSVLWKSKTSRAQNVVTTPKLHVRDAARHKMPSIFTRFFLKRNKVKPAVC